MLLSDGHARSLLAAQPFGRLPGLPKNAARLADEPARLRLHWSGRHRAPRAATMSRGHGVLPTCSAAALCRDHAVRTSKVAEMVLEHFGRLFHLDTVHLCWNLLQEHPVAFGHAQAWTIIAVAPRGARVLTILWSVGCGSHWKRNARPSLSQPLVWSVGCGSHWKRRP